MSGDTTTEPITIRAAKEVVSGIDALAAAMDRSCNDVADQALRQYLEHFHADRDLFSIPLWDRV